MNTGDVYYRRIDGEICIITGFFYEYYDGSRSSLLKNYQIFRKLVIQNELDVEHIKVLFEDHTFDSIENLFTDLYMTKREHEMSQEYSQDNYNGQYAEEVKLWNESDLVPNPK